MPDMPHITHHGAINGVTGSCHELRIDQHNAVLIDCGLFQGAETSGKGASFESLQIEFPLDHIKALLVTHCHIDHVGRIPYLFAAGFDGPIYCSRPTAELLPLVLEDAIKVGFTRDKALVQRVVKKITGKIIGIDYKKWTDLSGLIDNGDFKARFNPAGHILGSAYIEFDIKSSTVSSATKQKKSQRILFSGDLGAPYTPLLPAPKSPYSADIVVIESTYGDSLHEGRRNRRKQLKQIVEKCLQDSGVILIPAFSIGRTQELLYELEDIIHRFGSTKAAANTPWQDLEIIVDSPLAAKFTESYKKLKKYWDKEARKRKGAGRHPLSFEQLYCVDTHKEHMQTVQYLAKHQRPAIIIAASGMCAGGRIMNYLKATISDTRTDVVLVGYQARGTPGRAIQQYGPRGGYVELDGQRYDIQAGIHTLSGYSAHADQKDLVNFVKRMRHKPQEIRIVHGDDGAKRELQKQFKQLLPACDVVIPS